jgi:hypothetical protein
MKPETSFHPVTALICAAALFSFMPCKAEPAPPANQTAAPTEAPPHAVAAPAPHEALCAQLGLKVGRTYEFMIAGGEQIHYWTIRSLGANGWILAKDSRYPSTWVNLSQVTAVTPLSLKAKSTVARPPKPNQAR